MTYQLTAPLLDACVLGIVFQEDSYGYTLTHKMRQVVDISESTLYPVLRRLQKSGHLRTYDAPFQGRNRRYYAITDEGKGLLDYYEKEWTVYKGQIDGLIGVRNDSEPDETEGKEIIMIEETAGEEPDENEPETVATEGESDE